MAGVLFALAPVAAQEVVTTGPPPEIRALVTAVMEGLNGSAQAWEAMAKERFAKELLDQQTPQQRQATHDKLHADFGTVAMDRAIRRGPDAPLELHVKGSTGTTGVITLDITDANPPRIAKLTVQTGARRECGPRVSRRLDGDCADQPGSAHRRTPRRRHHGAALCRAMKIVVIEDDAVVSDTIALYLQQDGFDVVTARDGVTGLQLASAADASLVVLDLMIPGLPGLEVCRRLRATSTVPILTFIAAGRRSPGAGDRRGARSPAIDRRRVDRGGRRVGGPCRRLEHDPRLRMDVGGSLTARADAMRVRQVLLNLLTNADRHTPAGGTITVSGSRRGENIVIEVRNTGSALDDIELKRVFDRFYRADPARQRTTGGNGLGLAIVKHLVEAQGGTVSAASDNAGVAFSFTLPAQA